MIIKKQIGSEIIALQEASQVWMPTRFGEILGEIMCERLHTGGRVLELGSGSGVLCILAGKFGASVTALDINPAALTLTQTNWNLNVLPEAFLETRQSDLFSAMKPDEEGRFDLLISNPPTFPGLPDNRIKRANRDQWELAGEDGREILDAVITQGKHWLKSGGHLLTIATSKQSWTTTVNLMNEHWDTWKVIRTEDLPLADHYAEFIPLWISKSKATGEELIFEKHGKWFQRLYFIEATK